MCWAELDDGDACFSETCCVLWGLRAAGCVLIGAAFAFLLVAGAHEGSSGAWIAGIMFGLGALAAAIALVSAELGRRERRRRTIVDWSPAEQDAWDVQ